MLAVEGIEEFDQALEEFAEVEVPISTLDLQRQVAVNIFDRAKAATRKSSGSPTYPKLGHVRDRWGGNHGKRAGGVHGKSAMNASLKRAKPFGLIHVWNSHFVSYWLEHGTKKMRGDKMLTRAVNAAVGGGE